MSDKGERARRDAMITHNVSPLEIIHRFAGNISQIFLPPCDLKLLLQPGFLEGSGAHVLVLGPVSEGGCGVNHIGGTHELLHILGLAHTQNRPDRYPATSKIQT